MARVSDLGRDKLKGAGSEMKESAENLTGKGFRTPTSPQNKEAASKAAFGVVGIFA